METNNKIVEKIKLDKELLSTLSRNNKKNAEVYLEELKSRHSKYQVFKNKIIEVLNFRRGKIKDLVPNLEIEIKLNQINDLQGKLTLLNHYNSSYEKIELDRIIYDVSKYYKGTFSKVCSDILRAIETFEKVGINITANDFIYNPLAAEYMTVFLEQRNSLEADKLRHAFEKIYWKQPNIIKYIQLNFRYLFFKNIKLFDSYIEKISDELKPKEREIETELKVLKKQHHNLIKNSDYLFLNSFIKGELTFSDYSIKAVDEAIKIYSEKVTDEKSFAKVIDKLNITVNEYKMLLKYNFIIEDIKSIYTKSKESKDLVSSKNKIKEIKKIEDVLEELNGKKKLFSIFKKKKIESDKLVEKLMILYTELDEIIFREQLMEHINEDSKMIDVLKLASSYFCYIAKVLKVTDATIADAEIYNFYVELNQFIVSYDHSLITNLSPFEKYDLAMIISDKYKLDNLKITIDMLSKENLDKVLLQTTKIVNYYSIKDLQILKLSDLDDLFKIDKKLK